MFTADDLISCYTRAQAIEDGVLVVVSEEAQKAAKVLWPAVLTCALWSHLLPNASDMAAGESVEKRLHVLLCEFVRAVVRAKGSGGDQLAFHSTMIQNGLGQIFEVKVILGPDDEGKPCLTFMLPDED